MKRHGMWMALCGLAIAVGLAVRPGLVPAPAAVAAGGTVFPVVLPVGSTTETTVAAANTQLLQVDNLDGRRQISLEVCNTGTADLTAFMVLVHSGGQGWAPYLSGTDWSSTTNAAMEWCSLTPATLAAGRTAHLRFDVYGSRGFRVIASCGTSTTVRVQGQAVP